MSDPVDLLFIHVPRFSSYYRPYGEYMTINLIPMGTFALADLAVRQGYRAEILHLGLEWIEKEKFSPLSYLGEKNVLVVAISLNWHQQSYEVMPGNYVLRAIPLGAGHHHLSLIYEPLGFQIGKWISIVSTVLYVFSFAWYLRRRSHLSSLAKK